MLSENTAFPFGWDCFSGRPHPASSSSSSSLKKSSTGRQKVLFQLLRKLWKTPCRHIGKWRRSSSIFECFQAVGEAQTRPPASLLRTDTRNQTTNLGNVSCSCFCGQFCVRNGALHLSWDTKKRFSIDLCNQNSRILNAASPIVSKHNMKHTQGSSGSLPRCWVGLRFLVPLPEMMHFVGQFLSGSVQPGDAKHCLKWRDDEGNDWYKAARFDKCLTAVRNNV